VIIRHRQFSQSSDSGESSYGGIIRCHPTTTSYILSLISPVRRTPPQTSPLRNITQTLTLNSTFIIYKNLPLNQVIYLLSEFNRVTACIFLCHQVQCASRVDKAVRAYQQLQGSYVILFTSSVLSKEKKVKVKLSP
jgi:hypothetical protein